MTSPEGNDVKPVPVTINAEKPIKETGDAAPSILNE